MSDQNVTAEAAEEDKAPLMSHLLELRKRLMYALAVILVLFFAAYGISEHLYSFLAQPLADVLMAHEGGGQRMIFTAPHEAFLDRKSVV